MPIRRYITDAAFNGNNYRAAFAAAQARADDYGYEHIAGLHGLPLPMYCHADNSVFLPWHRAYLLQFEISVGLYVPNFALGVWDWRTPAGVVSNIPALFLPGAVGPGPLDSYAPTRLSANDLADLVRDGLLTGAPVHQTRREPGLPATPDLPVPSEVTRTLREPDYFLFQRALETKPHGVVHDWVGGTMGQVPSAAFDPIFWSHHAMIDAIWAAWEELHPHYSYPEAYLARPLPPFDLTVRKVISMGPLSYRYELNPPIA
jgi:tyrosinase